MIYAYHEQLLAEYDIGDIYKGWDVIMAMTTKMLVTITTTTTTVTTTTTIKTMITASNITHIRLKSVNRKICQNYTWFLQAAHEGIGRRGTRVGKRFYSDGLTYTKLHLMMTSSNENIFRVTGPLCGEFTGPRWIPLTKASDAERWRFFPLCLNKRLCKQSWGRWFETQSRSLWRHRNVPNPSKWHLGTVRRCLVSDHMFLNRVYIKTSTGRGMQRFAMDRFMSEQQHSLFNSFLSWQPKQVFQDWCNLRNSTMHQTNIRQCTIL